jgi:RNA polymerase-interacting CarD/CdnL/TRCF family regulator
METQAPGTATPLAFDAGTTVVYGLHGKCVVRAVENRELSGQRISFYKLEPQKSALSRSTRQEPAIWVPKDTAQERGLRAPLDADSAQAVLKIFTSREYYFRTDEPWATVQPQLDQAIRFEGAIGLAKVMSYLHVLKKRYVVPSSEITKLAETVNKLLLRELSEALGQPIRAVEDRIVKDMRHKLLADQ